ncbi:unnamed protein product [Owenia fusiformis]|uniref:Uncharacterized protein n=1 Tax=Owenia fusiformis TaxID=6347 RepID=A0A8J1XIR3_OWEFU|nr:unnamed protein product [Owenia fusiformis]
MNFRLVFVVTVLTYGQCSNGEQWDRDLQKALFKDYVASTRPHLNTTTNLTMGMTVRNLLHVHERSRAIKLKVWFRFFWNDERLRWDPKDYGNISILHFPTADLWTPDIVLYNNVNEDYTSLQDYSREVPVIVYNNGDIRWYFPGVIETNCPIDITMFPFDTQHCIVYFGSWTHTGKEIDTYPQDPKQDGENFAEPSGEWIFENYEAKRNAVKYVCCHELYVDVEYTLTLRRKPLFYITTLILPCLFLHILSTLGFLMPIESGSRAPLAIMVLLSMTVLQITVSSTISIQSDNVPLITQFIGFILLMMTLNVMLTIFSLNVHFNNHPRKTGPESKRFKVLKNIGRALGVSFEDNVSSARSVCNSETRPSANGFDQLHIESFDSDNACNVSKLTKLELRAFRPSADCVKKFWMKVAMVTDRIFALIFFVSSIVAFSLIFSQLLR